MILVTGSITARARDFGTSLQSLAAAGTTIELYDATRLEKL